MKAEQMQLATAGMTPAQPISCTRSSDGRSLSKSSSTEYYSTRSAVLFPLPPLRREG
jgi:hypothetical protein